MQCAWAILSSVACPALQYFSNLSYKWHDFIKKTLQNVTEYKMCVLTVSTPIVWNISHSKKKLARKDKKMYILLHVKYHLFLSGLNEIYFSNKFTKTPQITNFVKIHPLGAELFHAGGQTERHDEANSRFSQFCESALKTDCIRMWMKMTHQRVTTASKFYIKKAHNCFLTAQELDKINIS
jgi:hypothetical protein